MKIAVPYDNEQIFQHFGHTEKFKVFEVENGEIISSRVIDTKGQGHGALADLLAALGVTTLICGGIGGGAQAALAEKGIKLFGGVRGSCDDAVTALLARNLVFDPNVRCNHHDHDHGTHGHSCSGHSCSDHTCH